MSEKVAVTTVNGEGDDDGNEWLTIGRPLDGYFEFGDRVVVILASEYERLKRVEEAYKRSLPMTREWMMIHPSQDEYKQEYVAVDEQKCGGCGGKCGRCGE